MASLHWVEARARELFAMHLDERWSFGFDSAKRRAGITNYSKQRITLSRALAAHWEEAEVEQILLHEIAHAIAGHDAAHGPRWRSVAARLGYTGGRLHHGELPEHLAPWLGVCPAGHRHERFRRPTRPASCGKCSRTFSDLHIIAWRRTAPNPQK